MSVYKQEVRCQRCPRVEHEDVDLEEILAAAKVKDSIQSKHAVAVTMDGVEIVRFQTLCKPCQEIVTKHVRQIGHVSKHKSSTRKGDENE
jgi:hypothetical protein